MQSVLFEVDCGDKIVGSLWCSQRPQGTQTPSTASCHTVASHTSTPGPPGRGDFPRALTASPVSTRTMLNHASLGRCRHTRSQAARQCGAKFVVRASAEVNVTSTK